DARGARRAARRIRLPATEGNRDLAGVRPRPQRRESRARFLAGGTGSAMTVAPVETTLDHLIVGAATLAEGIEYVAGITGVTPVPGGKHAAMGTHNALLRLGDLVFLEVIAIDPDAK